MDDLSLGNEINEAFGIPPNDQSAAEEKVGESRLGSGSIGQSFGATLLVGTLVFTILILCIVLAIYIAKRVKLS